MSEFSIGAARGRGARGVRRFGFHRLVAAVVASVAVLGGASTAAAAAPSNDDFARARTLRVGTTVKGEVNGATRQRGEPRHARSSAKHSVWYRFRARRRLALGLYTCKANFDSVVAVYTAARCERCGPSTSTTTAAAHRGEAAG